MNRTPVKSSQIASIGYDAATKRLEIEFTRGGSAYQYDDVPADVYEKLISAESIGKAFDADIKGKFAFTKLALAA